MPRGIRAKSHEKLDDTNLQRVWEALNSNTPITKKEACEMLNICLLYTSPSPRDKRQSRMPSSA